MVFFCLNSEENIMKVYRFSTTLNISLEGLDNMTGSTEEYIEHVLELLEPINAISAGKFFGGQGISCNSVQFAMIMGNSLFFVVDDSTRNKYIEMGAECFWYTKKTGKVNVKKYHEVPGELFDEPDTLLKWARESIKIAKKLSKNK